MKSSFLINRGKYNMFSNIEYQNLSLWIDRNASSYLDNLKRMDYSKNMKEKILKFLTTLSNQESNYDEKLSDFIMQAMNVNKNTVFSSESFFDETSLENKVYYLLTNLRKLDAEEKFSFIDGLFMYVVQEQNIPMASLLYLYVRKDDKLSKNFLEFLQFEQNIDGSIGIINPLRDKNITPNEVKEWLLFNSLYVYIVLPLVNKEIVKD